MSYTDLKFAVSCRRKFLVFSLSDVMGVDLFIFSLSFEVDEDTANDIYSKHFAFAHIGLMQNINASVEQQWKVKKTTRANRVQFSRFHSNSLWSMSHMRWVLYHICPSLFYSII